ncbi:MAG: permease [Pseudomonadota bacterium]
MPAAHIVLYLVLVLVNVTFAAAWLLHARRRTVTTRPMASDVAIGVGTNFLDTLGIGNFAQITALFKLRGRPADELIPGTLNVGNAIPSCLGTLIFAAAIRVEPLLLTCMVFSAGCGAWFGAGVVSRMQRKTIQLLMGTALVLAAFFFILTNVGFLPAGGTAMGLNGWRFAVAVGANFVLGALMCAGIGNYAPSMALLALLGMHPVAAYPIMIGSDGILIPIASLGFLKSGRFDPVVALGLSIGGVIGTLLAFPLIAVLSAHLSLMRWLVIGVILYAAVSMLRSVGRPGSA